MRRRNPKLVVTMARRGMTGLDLATAAGLSRPTVSRLICLRQDPKPETAQAIADALGVTVKYLWPGME